ncbi:MAG: 2'-5' RNA ligase family protein [Bacteroidales bacterium]|nr:2'-5' RNA ligase family protein [Bacteroidales bacterium]
MRASDKLLYFIALIPHAGLREEIREIKERMRDEYGAGHALKSPAHITLQMPFKRSPGDEDFITLALAGFALKERPFRVELEGYGSFPPRVIHIRVSNPGPVRALHARLRELLLDDLGFEPQEVMRDVQPHITIATRDLTKTAFSEAWPVMKEEAFTGGFRAEGIFLLRHNGRSWDILKEFPFGEL